MKILILGGTKFVGIDIANKLTEKYQVHEIDFLNRGVSNKTLFKKHKTIFMDRNFPMLLETKMDYDLVIDISCYNLNQLKNVLNIINFKKYIFISSSAAENIKEDVFTKGALIRSYSFNDIPSVGQEAEEMFLYARNKRQCEDYIKQNIEKYLIIRPCYIVGKNDYTNRFYKKDNDYYWNNGLKLNYFIKSEDLAELVSSNIYFEKSTIFNPCV